MIHTSLRKVGGSVMLAVPPSLLKSLGLEAGKEVTLQIENGKLVVEAKKNISYPLEDLLAEHQSMDLEHDAWDGLQAVGREEP
ncbi:antitoxin ChpS [Acinetobacter calcoaceticus]|uniref:Antitoxin ChpS n=1 Tax=Acinetobacter calcoaceticus TaxID=471 RepID=A0A4R1Y5G0_ACICA|nr:antitoxin ChpS [Acinetobacter calcoaceticus]